MFNIFSPTRSNIESSVFIESEIQLYAMVDLPRLLLLLCYREHSADRCLLTLKRGEFGLPPIQLHLQPSGNTGADNIRKMKFQKARSEGRELNIPISPVKTSDGEVSSFYHSTASCAVTRGVRSKRKKPRS